MFSKMKEKFSISTAYFVKNNKMSRILFHQVLYRREIFIEFYQKRLHFVELSIIFYLNSLSLIMMFSFERFVN